MRHLACSALLLRRGADYTVTLHRGVSPVAWCRAAREASVGGSFRRCGACRPGHRTGTSAGKPGPGPAGSEFTRNPLLSVAGLGPGERIGRHLSELRADLTGIQEELELQEASALFLWVRNLAVACRLSWLGSTHLPEPTRSAGAVRGLISAHRRRGRRSISHRRP